MADTVNILFAESVATFGDRPALASKTGSAYRAITYRELAEQVRVFATGLLTLGVQSGDRIALIS